MDKTGLLNNKTLDNNHNSQNEANNYQLDNMLLKLSSDVMLSNLPMRFTPRSNVERILETLNVPTKENQTIIKKHLQLLQLSHSIEKQNNCSKKYNNNDHSNKPTLINKTITLPNIDRQQLIQYINKDAKKIKASYHNKTYFKGLQVIAISSSTRSIHHTTDGNNKYIHQSTNNILDEMRDYNQQNITMINNTKHTKSKSPTNIRLNTYSNSNQLQKQNEIYRKTIMEQLTKIAFVNDDHSKETKQIIESHPVRPSIKIENVAINILQQNEIYRKKKTVNRKVSNDTNPLY